MIVHARAARLLLAGAAFVVCGSPLAMAGAALCGALYLLIERRTAVATAAGEADGEMLAVERNAAMALAWLTSVLSGAWLRAAAGVLLGLVACALHATTRVECAQARKMLRQRLRSN